MTVFFIFISVATKDNIVAIFGFIIPDPFVTPVIFIYLFLILTFIDTTLFCCISC